MVERSRASERLAGGVTDAELGALRSGERPGRPAGSEAFVKALESDAGRVLVKRKVGRRPKAASETTRTKLVQYPRVPPEFPDAERVTVDIRCGPA